MCKFARSWPKLLALFLTLSCVSFAPACCSSTSEFSLQSALMSRFQTMDDEIKQISSRESSDLTTAQLKGGLEVLLNSPAQYTSLEFTGVFELAGDTALRIILSCQQAASSQLSADAFLLWMNTTAESLHNLPGDECQPLVRRFIVATIVKHWLSAGPMSVEEETQATALMAQLYLVHAKGAKAKPALEYMHISKSGGTSMCHTAELNGCKTEDFDDGRTCQVFHFDDRVRWISAHFHRMQLRKINPNVTTPEWARFGNVRKSEVTTCAGRVEHLQKKRWNFYANEYTLMGGSTPGEDGFRHVHLCKPLFNVLIFREPIHRLMSHLDFILFCYTRYVRPFNDAYIEGRDSAFWQKLAPAPLDNYMTRSMLGDVVFNLPAGELEDRHMQAARLVLQQYDVLLLLSAPPLDTQLGFNFGLAWQVDLRARQDRSSTKLMAPVAWRKFIPHDIATVVAQHTLDTELYLYALVLTRLDHLVWDVAAAQGLHPVVSIAPSSIARGGAAERRMVCGYQGIAEQDRLVTPGV